MSYSFNESKHIHLLDDKPLHGITTVLKVINKPFLIQWSANMACDYVRTNLKDLNNLEEVLNKAKTAYRIKQETASDFGTNLHKAIEVWIKEKKEPILQDTPKILFNKFKEWVDKENVKFIESEKHVWSKDLWIGGILDLVITINDKKYIGDIKTSSGIYNEAFFQMAAYDLCLQEMKEHQNIEGYVVINLKKDGNLDFKLATNKQLNQDAFKYALNLYKIISSLE